MRRHGKADALGIAVREAPAHDDGRFRIGVDEMESAPVTVRRIARRAAPREKIQNIIAGIGVNLDDALDHAHGLLRRIPRFFLAIGAHDRVPPDVGRSLAERSLLGPDEAGGHVWDTIHLPKAKDEISGSFANQ